ncbi:MAG: PCP reductase family protein [Gammaproteobacteria bacterium]|nr:PCP reductase family protein [Gammaproteobacteria bacterium]
MHVLSDPPDVYVPPVETDEAEAAAEADAMELDAQALEMLAGVPKALQKMVRGQVEGTLRDRGENTVTGKLFEGLAREFGLREELLDRYRTDADKPG